MAERNAEIDRLKANLATKVKSDRLRAAICGQKADDEESFTGARQTRAVRAMEKIAPGIVALEGAKFGRLDLTKDGPRFGGARKRRALKEAASASALVQAFKKPAEQKRRQTERRARLKAQFKGKL